MKKYNTPEMNITSFNKESILTGSSMSSMQALEDWKAGQDPSQNTLTRGVNFEDAAKILALD